MPDTDDATPLDQAHAAMAAAPEDDGARLAYYSRLADEELFLWLAAEPQGTAFEPQTFAVEEGPLVLAFDREDRLAAAAGAPVPYVALPGRIIAQALAGQGVGLGLNLGVTHSAFIVPPEALKWLTDLLARTPVPESARPVAFHAPGALPAVLVDTLGAKLAPAKGMAAAALLAGVEYEDGRRGHLLAFVAAVPEAQVALARAASEALTFSGIEAGQMDVAFLPADHAAVPALARVARPFAMQREVVEEAPAAPALDRPPRLR